MSRIGWPDRNRSIAFPKAQIAARVNRVLLCQTLRDAFRRRGRMTDLINLEITDPARVNGGQRLLCRATNRLSRRSSPPRNHFPDIPYRFGEPTTWRNKLAFLVLSTDFLFCFVLFFLLFFLASCFFSSLFSFFFFFIFYFDSPRETYRVVSRMFHLANENLDDRYQF